jgi:predicted PurR-regulated permease PerM
VFAVLLVLLSAWVAFEFLPSLAWAVILAIATWPVYDRVEGYLSKENSPVSLPLVFTLPIGAMLFAPLVLALQQLAGQSESLTRWLTELREQGIPVPGWVGQLPIAGEYLAEWWRSNLTDGAARAWLSGISAEGIAGWMQALGGQLLHRLFMFLITLIALFVLLRDGLWIASRVLETADRILGDPGERLATKMVDAVRSTVTGTISVAFTEGVLIGIGYFIAGVPNGLLFMFLTMAFAMLPFGAWVAFTRRLLCSLPKVRAV